jgi:hypothetical protein
MIDLTECSDDELDVGACACCCQRVFFESMGAANQKHSKQCSRPPPDPPSQDALLSSPTRMPPN